MRKVLISFAIFSVFFAGAATAETVDAVWKKQEVKFGYLALETAYSCTLMEARIKMLLRHVGAGEDIKVKMPPCEGFDRPQNRFRITAEFSALKPAAEGDTDIVKAEWDEVTLGKWDPYPIDDSDCRLIEHFTKHLLPSIEHEVVAGKTRCGATDHILVGKLKLKVLKPVEEKVASTD